MCRGITSWREKFGSGSLQESHLATMTVILKFPRAIEIGDRRPVVDFRFWEIRKRPNRLFRN